MLRETLIQKGLSNREAEVAVLVSQGLPNKEVAEKLFVTEKTVKFHLTNIYKKMSVKSRAQLIVWCLPHMSFVENEAPAQAGGGAYGSQQQAQSISAGRSTVTETVAPTFLPHSNNGFGTGNGGSDQSI